MAAKLRSDSGCHRSNVFVRLGHIAHRQYCQNAGSCHGSALGYGRPPAATPATTHATTHATTRAATPTVTLQIVAVGRHDLSFEAYSIQDLEALADTKLLQDIRTASVYGATAESFELTGGSVARGVSGLAPGTEWDGAMQS